MRRRDFLALLGGVTTLPLPGVAMARSHSECLADQFHRLAYACVPSLIPEANAKSFEISTRSLPSRRVICGDPNVSWEEQEIPQNHALHDFFLSQPVRDTAAALLNISSPLRHFTGWISRYRQNEYIGPHQDRAGTLQIVLALDGTGGDNGGTLNLLIDGETIALRLNPGDALFFKATSITHYTTPLIATARCPDPVRVV